MVHTLKVVWTSDSGESEIRRLTVPDDTISQYTLLAEKIVKLFPQLSGQCFQLGWKDSEGDYIVMSSDEELAQAVANALENGVIKIFVSVKTAKNADHKPKSSILHPNVVCDGCNGAVHGYRYKCLECLDYDLCGSCHAEDKHPGHDMLKISTPVGQSPNWMFPGWRRMYRSMFGRHPFGGAHCGGGKFFKPGGRRCGPKQAEGTDKKEQQANSPSSPHSEFLKNIGKSVAFFLDPLGIDVDVMVSESDTDSGDSTGNKKGAEAQTDAEETEPKNVAEENTEVNKDSKNDAACPTPEAQDEQTPNATAPLNDSGVEINMQGQGACPKNYGLFQKTDSKVDSNENRGSSPESFNGHDDWTVVNNIPNGKDEKSGVAVENLGPGEKVSYPVLPEEKMSASADVQKEDVPRDPKVANALSKMYAMGFTNEGGWLLRLLETKNGNINEVLDALYPNRH